MTPRGPFQPLPFCDSVILPSTFWFLFRMHFLTAGNTADLQASPNATNTEQWTFLKVSLETSCPGSSVCTILPLSDAEVSYDSLSDDWTGC